MSTPTAAPEPAAGLPRPRRRSPPASHGRTKARRAAVQALYQWEMAGHDLREVEEQFLAEREMRGVDLAYFHELLFQVPARLGDLERQFTPFLDRPVGELDPVERAILRVGAYELQARPEVPYRVVINEGLELAKRFGAEQSHRYINTILDKLARKLRENETMRRKG